jgi:hypothetical protein
MTTLETLRIRINKSCSKVNKKKGIPVKKLAKKFREKKEGLEPKI